MLTEKPVLQILNICSLNEKTMGRNRILRQVLATPAVKGFRPFGRIGGKRPKVIMLLDEYEAIRLLDHENLTQEEAAEAMNVSRPTLTRIYDRARRKFASALVEGALLLIEGGDIRLKQHDWLCEDCGACTRIADDQITHCPVCKSPSVTSLKECYLNRCQQCKIITKEVEMPRFDGTGPQNRKPRRRRGPCGKVFSPDQRRRFQGGCGLYRLHGTNESGLGQTQAGIYEYSKQELENRKQALEKQLSWINERLAESGDER